MNKTNQSNLQTAEEIKGSTGCQLSNSELIKSLREWSSKLCSTGGKAWSLQVPVNLNKDPDILIEEMCQRLAALHSYRNQPGGEGVGKLINEIDKRILQCNKKGEKFAKSEMTHSSISSHAMAHAYSNVKELILESYASQSLPQQPVSDNELFNFLVGTDKPFLIDTTRDIISEYIKKELSLSKLVETLNEASYNWHKSKPVSAGLRWVKASERNPDNGEVKFIKYEDYKDTAYFQNDVWYFSNSDVALLPAFLRNLEWFDESATPQPTGGMQEVVKSKFDLL